eukprot:m.399283 g.399283  ORF g.399283 m.399283 type:complete len:80 (+) comp28379_c1_seq23:173-412(+)
MVAISGSIFYDVAAFGWGGAGSLPPPAITMWSPSPHSGSMGRSIEQRGTPQRGGQFRTVSAVGTMDWHNGTQGREEGAW